jgi:exosortase A
MKLVGPSTSEIGLKPHFRGYLVATPALILGAIILILGRTAADVVNTWYTSNAYSHGFLILPICLYLVWRKRSDLANIRVHPDLRGLGPVVLAALAWLLGHLLGAPLLEELSLVACIQSVIFTMLGWPMTRALVFPLAYLYFAIPFGQAIEPQLQANTAKLAVEMLRLTGIPVFADGNLISVPSGNFDVAEACSGLRFLTASLAIGTLFAGIMFRSWFRRAAFLGLSVALPIVANGARAFGIIWLSYVTSNQLAAGVDHIVYGWIFFSLIMFVMLAIGVRFRDEWHDSRIASLEGSAGLEAPWGSRSLIFVGLIALVPLLSARLYGDDLDRRPVTGIAQLTAPRFQAGWHEMAGAVDPLRPVFVGADAELHKGYTNGATHAYIHIAYFIRNRRGAQAVSSAHDFGDEASGWRMAAAGTQTINIEGREISAQSVRSARGNVVHLTWYWYWVGGQYTGDPYRAKLLEAKSKLLGGNGASALIAITTDDATGPLTADQTLREFSAALYGLAADLSKATH